MQHPVFRRNRSRIVVLLVAGGLIAASAGGALAASSEPLEATEVVDVDLKLPAPDAEEPELANSALRRIVGGFERGELPGPDVAMVDGALLVDIKHELSSNEVGALIADLGGRIYAELPGVLLEAWIPIDRLVELEAHRGVRYVQPPPPSLPLPLPEVTPPINETSSLAARATPIVGEEVAKTRADVWHAAGITGNGVKVGIIDLFGRNIWDAAEAAGEVPTPAGIFCRLNDQDCGASLFDLLPNAEHGTAVAEVIHEMAPGAELYLATALTAGEYTAAVDYFASQGVTVVNNSNTAYYDGPGDGTGLRAEVVNHAVSLGMTWFNSAGNSAGDDDNDGKYWRGQWTDADGDGWLEWTTGKEVMPFFCSGANGLRWSDWGAANPTDYNLYVWDTADDIGTTTFKAKSEEKQTEGADPVENYGMLTCTTSSDVDFLAVALIDGGNGTSGDVLEFMVLGGGLLYWQNPYSASGPYSDTASGGGLAVGAIDPPAGSTIGDYSSRGPTNDERTKPDLSAAAGMVSLSYGHFPGTSAASPTAAGAAALVLESGLATTPSQVKDYLLSEAVVDRGASGTDNTYGAGELRLPDPPMSHAPVAADDGPYTVERGAVLNVAAPGVLGNDTDPDGDTLTAHMVTGPAHGAFLLGSDGSFIYTHDGSTTTTDSFTYRASDGAEESNVATVTITILSPSAVSLQDGGFEAGTPNPYWDEASTNFDTPLCSEALCGSGVLGPHSGDWWAWFGGIEGEEAGAVAQTFDIEPGDNSLSFYLAIPVADVNSLLQVDMDGDVLFTVTDADQAAYATYTEVVIDISAYADGASHTLGIASAKLAGGHANYFVDDVSVVTVAPTTGTVTGNVRHNGAPLAGVEVWLGYADRHVCTHGDGTFTFTDVPAGETLVAVTGPAEALACSNADFVNASGQPLAIQAWDHKGYNESWDEFTLTAGEVKNITFDVVLRQAPVAVDDTASVDNGASVAIDVLGNDQNPEGFALEIVKTSDPAHGTAALRPDGTFLYTHDGSATTSDSFTYKLDDGVMESAPAIVTITITQGNSPPVASDDGYAVERGAVLTVAVPGVLGNDTDPDGDTLTAHVVTGPAHGALVLGSDGSFTYTHDGSATTSDSFTYRANDGTADSNTATVTLTVFASFPGWPPCDFTPFSISGVGSSVPALQVPEDKPAILDITHSGTGMFSVITLDAGHQIIDFAVTDLGGGYRGVRPVNQQRIFNDVRHLDIEASGAWTVEVRPICTARSMIGDSASGQGDDVVIVNRSGTATITHGGTGHFSVWSHQSYTEMDLEVNEIGLFNGQVEIDAGTIFLDVSADDTDGVWSVSFLPNSPPVASDDGYAVERGAVLTVAVPGVLGNDTDPDGDTLTANVVTGPAHGALLLGSDGSFTYTHDGSATTSDSFTYRANDGTADSNTATVTIGVTQVLPTVLAPTSVGLVDPSQGRWHLREYHTGAVTSFYFGNPGDVPFMGDWDCDGDATPGLFRTSDAFAYLRNSNSVGIADIRFFFGNPSDVPLAGDFNGDGCDTLSIYRPSEQRFYIMNELGENEGGLGAADYFFTFGNPGDKPVVGDWDGDGIDEVGLHRESTGFFYYRNSLDTGIASAEFYFGDPGDRFVAGDWGTVDGVETPAVYRPSNTTFYFRHTNTPGVADSEFVWGDSAWIPVSGVTD